MRSCDIVVHPDCVRVADELAHYSYKQDPLTNEVLPVLDDKHNHTIDACRYSLESVRRRRRHGAHFGATGDYGLGLGRIGETSWLL